MRLIGYQESELKVSKVDSLRELQELRRSGEIDRIIDENIEAPRSYFLVHLLQRGINVGIVSSGLGHNTGIVNLGRLALIYNDQHWYLFTSNGQLVNQGSCDGIIYEIAPSNSGFIVIHEIGAEKFTFDGKRLWKIDSDLVDDHRIEKDTLVLVSGGNVNSFDKESGRKTS